MLIVYKTIYVDVNCWVLLLLSYGCTDFGSCMNFAKNPFNIYQT